MSYYSKCHKQRSINGAREHQLELQLETIHDYFERKNNRPNIYPCGGMMIRKKFIQA